MAVHHSGAYQIGHTWLDPEDVAPIGALMSLAEDTDWHRKKPPRYYQEKL